MSGYFIREVIGDYIDAKIGARGNNLDEALLKAEKRLDAALEELFTGGQLRAASDAADKAGEEFDFRKEL